MAARAGTSQLVLATGARKTYPNRTPSIHRMSSLRHACAREVARRQRHLCPRSCSKLYFVSGSYKTQHLHVTYTIVALRAALKSQQASCAMCLQSRYVVLLEWISSLWRPESQKNATCNNDNELRLSCEGTFCEQG